MLVALALSLVGGLSTSLGMNWSKLNLFFKFIAFIYCVLLFIFIIYSSVLLICGVGISVVIIIE